MITLIDRSLMHISIDLGVDCYVHDALFKASVPFKVSFSQMICSQWLTLGTFKIKILGGRMSTCMYSIERETNKAGTCLFGRWFRI